MMRLIQNALSLLLVAGVISTASAQSTLYWDLNGTAEGVGNVGGFQDGDWTSSTANWNTDPTGGAAGAITTFAPGDNAVFSAGTDATDGIVLIPSGQQQQPNSITIEEGRVEFSNANSFNMLANTSVRVNEGATLQIPNLNVFAMPIDATGVTVTLDGGTFRNTIVGGGSGIFRSPDATPTQFLLTSKGGRIDTPNGGGDNPNGAYSIMQYGTATSAAVIGMTAGTTSAKLRKTGHGEFRALNNWTFTELDVESGLYRINSSGGTDSGFGSANSVVTVFGGAQENTTNGAALGTSASIVSPATRSFVLGGTGDSIFVTNATFRINGPISGNGGLMLNGWARNDGGGTSSVIGTQTTSLILGGTNTYAGSTTINFGTLTTAAGSAIPDSSRVIFSTRSVWGGNSGGTTATFNTAVLGVGANETIGSLAGGNATRGSVNITGAAVTLTTGADNTSSTYSGAITGSGSLAKTGDGTFTMDGVKSYTGNTSVLDGVLSTNSASLADLADVLLATGGVFNLNFAGTDVIDSLFINGVSQAIGTWGGTGSGATNISPLLSGTGLLQVSTSTLR